MSFTRKTLADAIDAYDADIEILQQSKRETFTDYREQLAEEGRDKDAVKDEIAAFKAAMKLRRAVAKEGNEAVEDQANLVDEIFVEITAARAPRATRVENIEEFPAEDPEVTAQKARLAELRAHPAIVSVDKLKSQSQPLNQAGQTVAAANSTFTSPTGSEAVEIPAPVSMQEPHDEAQGQGGVDEHSDAEGSQASLPSDPVENKSDAPTVIAGEIIQRAPAAPVSKYAQKGVITWQHTPPEGVIRHDYSVAFGEAGQDIAVIEDDVANAASAPIVMIGNVILDGWARYMKARELGIEYPAVQYDGSDSLMDVIKWNVGGRLMTSEQTFRIAQKLSRAEPKRKADIYAAFELGMELA